MKQIFANITFVVLSVLLFSCNLEEIINEDKKDSFLTASDGTRCIRMEEKTCITKEENISITIIGAEGYLDENSLTEYPDCTDCLFTYEIEGFEFEWGYIQVLKVQATTYYRPDIFDASVITTKYKYLETVSKKPLKSGFPFRVSLYDYERRSSKLHLFDKGSNGEFSYFGKQFECKEPTTCDELFSFKDKEPLDICSVTLEFKFQDSPEQNLVLESMETNECRE